MLSRSRKSVNTPSPSNPDNSYEVEDILEESFYNDKKWLLIKWKGYPLEDCSWEPVSNLINGNVLLSEWNNKKHSIREKARQMIIKANGVWHIDDPSSAS
jgi:hypothetical protein